MNMKGNKMRISLKLIIVSLCILIFRFISYFCIIEINKEIGFIVDKLINPRVYYNITFSMIFALISVSIILRVVSGVVKRLLLLDLKYFSIHDFFKSALLIKYNTLILDRKYEAITRASDARSQKTDNLLVLLELLFFISMSLYVMLKIDWISSVVFIIFISCSNMISWNVGKKIDNIVDIRESNARELTGFFGSIIPALTNIHVFDKVKRVQVQFDKIKKNYEKNSTIALKKQLIWGFLPSIISLISIGIVLGISAYRMNNGLYSFSSFIYFVLVMLPLDDYLQDITNTLIDYRISDTVYRSSYDEIFNKN